MPRTATSSLSVRDFVPLVASAAVRHGADRLLLLQGRADGPGLPVFDARERRSPGLDFATQDYLALGAHPALRSAAMGALGHHRLCAPGTTPQLGLTLPVLALEDRVAGFLHLPHAVSFPSGAEAIRATMHALLFPGDEVIVDQDAHPAMFEAVLIARARLHRCPAGSIEAVERRLRRLGGQRRRGRVWLAVPSISAHRSAMYDLAELSALCRTHGAGLIVDVTHDLGAMGQSGTGVMEIQNCLGRPDVVVGSFAKCFGASGGFAAMHDPTLKDRLRNGRPGQWRTAALSAVNAAVILAAFDLIDSTEGRRRRRRLHGSTLRLRNHLMADGLRVMGQPSPLVPVRLSATSAQLATQLLQSAGPRVTLLQAPLVAAHAPRWRIQLSSDHGAADIDDLAELIRDVTRTVERRSRPPRRSDQ
jgi:glycine C-acetyltransferase